MGVVFKAKQISVNRIVAIKVLLDSLAQNKEFIRRFEREFLDHVGRSRSAIYDAIVQTGKLGDDTVGELEAAITAFKQGFQTGEGKSLVNEAPAEAMDAEERGQEKITRYAQPSSKKR